MSLLHPTWRPPVQSRQKQGLTQASECNLRSLHERWRWEVQRAWVSSGQLSLGATAAEARVPRACALQQETPLQREALTLKLGRAPCSPQLETGCAQNKDPVQPRLNKLFKVEVIFSTLVRDNDSLCCCFLPKLCPALFSPRGR